MSEMQKEILNALIKEKKYESITEYVSIIHQNKSKVFIETYNGECMRLRNDDDGSLSITVPNKMSDVQCGGLANAIVSGTIFDDADVVDRHADYITRRVLPMQAIENRGGHMPHGLKPIISTTIGTMNDEDGRVHLTPTDMNNGINMTKELMHHKPKCCEEPVKFGQFKSFDVRDCKDEELPDIGRSFRRHKDKEREIKDIVDNYLGEKNHDDLSNKFTSYVIRLDGDLENNTPVTGDDELDVSDYDEIHVEEPEQNGDDYDKDFQEGFFSKSPKKLKPLTRDIIAYITCEKNAIKNANDQAMLAGYTCSKLELCDFYITCLETNDARYVVPHTKDYLIYFQKELNRLLTEILNVMPINRNDRVWIKNVTLPEGR